MYFMGVWVGIFMWVYGDENCRGDKVADEKTLFIVSGDLYSVWCFFSVLYAYGNTSKFMCKFMYMHLYTFVHIYANMFYMIVKKRY